MKPQGKAVVVTGAGNGIGRAVALELLNRGATVAGVDLSADGLAETIQLAGVRAKNMSAHAVSVADRKLVAALPAVVIKKHGQVDGLINVAGIIQKFVKINELDYADAERVFNVNFYGTLNMVKEFLPHLLARPHAQIVNISSMGGYVPVPGQSIYGASKAAVKLMTEALRSELAGTNVGVSLVFPGAVSTNICVNSGVTTEAEARQMASDPNTAKFSMSTPEKAGQVIADAFERNPFHSFIGSDATLMDRISRLSPERAAKLIQKQMASLLS
jgi:NAD(P)-dependent dehydrogenase (short-subunit alcohol dehydrogenase family)